jgi:1,4-dihydroxy-2-naphthoate octaprenyltransferase
MSFKKSLASWLTLIRLGPTGRGVLPFFLGVVIAWSQGTSINWPVFVLASVVVFAIMVMTFLVNEYYDYETDLINKDFHRLSGGTRVLPMGLISPHQALVGAYVCLIISAAIGLLLYFYYKTGPCTIPLGALAIFIGYFYTAKPLQLCYRGLGEVAIWFSCGWLATISGYYLQTGHFDTVTTLASLPGATSVFLVILINEFPDVVSDRISGKRNLAVRLGKEKAAILYSALLILCYINIIAIVPFGVPAISGLFSLALLPFIVWNIRAISHKGSVDDGGALEGLSIRTMIIDHLITFIYTAAFIITGLGLATVGRGQILAIGIAYATVFALEGFGLVCSKLVTTVTE